MGGKEQRKATIINTEAKVITMLRAYAETNRWPMILFCNLKYVSDTFTIIGYETFVGLILARETVAYLFRCDVVINGITLP